MSKLIKKGISVDLKERVAKVLTDEVAPALAMDGVQAELVDVTDGVARLRLHGGCLTCPGTLVSVIHGIEQELHRRLPEVENVEFV